MTYCFLIAFFEQVVYNVGLCICLYDITKLEDSYIFPGDGASHTKGMCLSSGTWFCRELVIWKCKLGSIVKESEFKGISEVHCFNSIPIRRARGTWQKSLLCTSWVQT